MALTTQDLLWVRVQIALGCTQAGLAELVGVERRTIQRWQDRGAIVLPDHLLKLAAALDAVSPDLAAEVRAIASQDPTTPTEPVVLAKIVDAAATTLGMPPQAVKQAVEAVFRTAKAHGASVDGVLLQLELEASTAKRGA